MRIAFVVTEFPSDTQTFVVKQLEFLLEQDHDVSVFVRPQNYTPEKPSLIHDVYRRIDWRRRTHNLGRDYQWSSARKTAGLCLRLLGAALRAPGDTLRALKKIRQTAGFSKRALLLALRCLPFVGRRLELIHFHFTWSAMDVEALGSILGLPVVITCYGSDLSLVEERDVLRTRSVLQHADEIICTSELLCGLAQKFGAASSKLTRNYPEIDAEFFTPAKQQSESPSAEPRLIVSVARLHWKKGFIDGLYAAALLEKKGIDFRWEIYGEGPEYSAIKAAIADLGLGPHVRLRGFIEPRQVREAMRSADVFFLPSVREEFGAVLAEAQACETPVVACRVGGVGESVADGISGFLVPSRDHNAMAERLAHVLTLPDGGREFGIRGRQRVKELFSRRATGEKLLEVYRRACRRHGAEGADDRAGVRSSVVS